MSGPAKAIEALVLNRQTTGENLQHLTLLCPESGLISALHRLPGTKRGPKTPAIDLLDQIRTTIVAPRVGDGLFFANQLDIIKRHTAIGTSYARLEAAMAYARLLARNAGHLEDHGRLYRDALQFFAVLEETALPEAAFLKALYRFLRSEGYPAREDWLPAAVTSGHTHAAQILKTPLSNLTVPAPEVHALLDSLKAWTIRETDLLLD